MAPNSSDFRPFASNLIRKAATGDVEFLSTRLRDADMKELKAAGYFTALSALQQGLAISDQCYTGLDPSSGFPAVLYSSPYAGEALQAKGEALASSEGGGLSEELLLADIDRQQADWGGWRFRAGSRLRSCWRGNLALRRLSRKVDKGHQNGR